MAIRLEFFCQVDFEGLNPMHKANNLLLRLSNV
jgi:hypothetical protein